MFRASPWISYDPSRPPESNSPRIDSLHIQVPSTASDSNSNTDNNTDNNTNPAGASVNTASISASIISASDPTSTNTVKGANMDEDGDIIMDAPQISTLSEEASPPPAPAPPANARVTKFRVNLKVSEPSAGAHRSNVGLGSSPLKGQNAGDSEEDDEDEDEEDEEEDQLADDDDLPSSIAPASSATGTPVRPPPTARARAPPTSRARGRGRGRGRGALSATEPPQYLFEIAPSGSQDSERRTPSFTMEVGNTGQITPVAPPKKKASRKNATGGGGLKAIKKPKGSKALLQVQEDTGSVTEFGTAASSPAIREVDTPDIDIDPIALSPPHASSEVPEFHLDPTIPFPVYRLPTRPFLVQPLPKIQSGFAPPMPLDKTHAKVRHWRRANRVIRGIAGGQWLVPMWVGDKDSGYATATGRATDPDGVDAGIVTGTGAAPPSVTGAMNAPKGRKSGGPSAVGSPATHPVSIPKLPALPVTISIANRGRRASGPPPTSLAVQNKLSASGSRTASTSRSTSVEAVAAALVPDVPVSISIPSNVARPPSKMRQSLIVPDVDGDGDIKPDVGKGNVVNVADSDSAPA